MTDPVVRELEAIRAEQGYPEALQQLPEQPDDFTISMRMWAVMICGGIACWAVIIGLAGRGLGLW